MGKIKKIAALLLSIIIIISCAIFPSGSVSAASKTSRYTVLVLDTTGQYTITTRFFNTVTVGSPLSKVKQAANVFVEKVLSAEGNNHVAIVTCNENGKVLADFSDSAQTLKNAINNISETNSGSSTGFSNFNEALGKADELLKKATEANVIKNLLFFSGCLPAAGKHSATGHYSSSSYDYYVVATSVKVKDHANVVYDTATRMKNSGYNLYTLSCFTNLDQQKDSFDFANLVMEDMQNKGYYNAENPDDLIDEITDIAEDIIQPLEVTVSHTQKSVTRDIRDFNYTTTLYVNNYIFEIKATIKNSNNRIAEKVTAKLELPNGMGLESGNVQQTINQIAANSSTTVTWQVNILGVVDNKNLDYAVTVASENSLPVSAYGKIFVKGAVKNNNILIFGEDTWKFSNYGETPIPISNKDLDALKHGRSNGDKEAFDTLVAEGAGGQCAGMAITSVLAKVNRLNINDIQSGAVNLSAIDKNDNAKSIIGYYYLTQFLEPYQTNKTEFQRLSVRQRLQRIEELADAVDSGGNPFVIMFGRNDNNPKKAWGHAVTAYSLERGSFKIGGFLRVETETYDSRILIYDNKSPSWDKDYCLYFNQGTDQWVIPNYNDANTLRGAFSDINLMDESSLEMNKNNVKSYIRAKENTDLLIKSANIDATVSQIINNQVDNAVAFPDDALGDSNAMNIFFDNMEQAFTIKANGSDQLLDASINYNNYHMAVLAPQDANSVGFNPEGKINIDGNVNNFSLSLAGNEGHYNLPWYTIKVLGDSASNPELFSVDKGCILNAKNMQNIKIVSKNDSELKELLFNTDNDSVLIGELNGELAVYTDEDGNGEYETLIASSDGFNKPTDPDQPVGPTPPESPKDGLPTWAIILISFGGLLLIGLIVLFIVLNTNKKSKEQDESFEIPVIQSERDFSDEKPVILEAPIHDTSDGSISILTGSMKGASIQIKDGETINLGKDSKLAHIVFTNDYNHVSRIHCTITYNHQADKYYVTDSSSNGTYFENKVRLVKGQRTPVKRGTIILLADSECKIKLN